MKDEILEAVSAALADLRKEHTAELAALRAEFEALREQDRKEAKEALGDVVETAMGWVSELRGAQEKTGQDLEALVEVSRELGAEVERKTDTAHVDEVLNTVLACNEHFSEVIEETAEKTRTTLLEAFNDALNEALEPLERELQTKITRGALDCEWALMATRIDAGIATLGEQLTTKATPEMVVEAVAPVREQLAALTGTVELDRITNQERATTLITETDAALTEMWAALRVEIDTKATQEHVDTVVGSLAKGVNTMRQDFGVEHLASEARLRMQVEDLENDLGEAIATVNNAIAAKADPADYQALLETLRTDMVHRYQDAEQWARGGPPYQRHALVIHRGGLWQALETTTDEPGTDVPTWALLADALESIEMERRDDGRLVFVSKMVSGRTQEFSVREPVPTFKGVYDPDALYEPWDTVAKDSHVFLCLRATMDAPGENLGEWQVFSGPRGAKGRVGKDGAHGVSPPKVDEDALVTRVMHQVVPQLQNVVDEL